MGNSFDKFVYIYNSITNIDEKNYKLYYDDTKNTIPVDSYESNALDNYIHLQVGDPYAQNKNIYDIIANKYQSGR